MLNHGVPTVGENATDTKLAEQLATSDYFGVPCHDACSRADFSSSMSRPLGSAGGDSFTAFPPPPPHWRLFGQGQLVHVAPPRPPSGPCFVFGKAHTLDPRSVTLDPEEQLCDFGADLGDELLRLQRALRDSSCDLLRCLVENAADHPRHLRHIGQLMDNFRALLHRCREREARLLVILRYREQVARKRAFIADAGAALPGLEARVDSLLDTSFCQKGSPEVAEEKQEQDEEQKKEEEEKDTTVATADRCPPVMSMQSAAMVVSSSDAQEPVAEEPGADRTTGQSDDTDLRPSCAQQPANALPADRCRPAEQSVAAGTALPEVPHADVSEEDFSRQLAADWPCDRNSVDTSPVVSMRSVAMVVSSSDTQEPVGQEPRAYQTMGQSDDTDLLPNCMQQPANALPVDRCRAAKQPLAASTALPEVSQVEVSEETASRQLSANLPVLPKDSVDTCDLPSSPRPAARQSADRRRPTLSIVGPPLASGLDEGFRPQASSREPGAEMAGAPSGGHAGRVARRRLTIGALPPPRPHPPSPLAPPPPRRRLLVNKPSDCVPSAASVRAGHPLSMDAAAEPLLRAPEGVAVKPAQLPARRREPEMEAELQEATSEGSRAAEAKRRRRLRPLGHLADE